MRQDIAIEWEQALRTGQLADGTPVRQGREHLTTIDDGKQFDCCLGVLCKIAILHGEEVEVEVYDDREDDDSVQRVYYSGSEMFPPGIVQRWAEMDSASGEYGESTTDTLAYANDDLGYDFVQIADLIHEHWEVL